MVQLVDADPNPLRIIPLLARVLYEWALWWHAHGRDHRAVPLVLEAAALLTPPQDNRHARQLAVCSPLMRSMLHTMGRLDEAEAAFVTASSGSKGDLRVIAQAGLAEVLLHQHRLSKALELARTVEQGLEKYKEAFPLAQYHRLLMTIAEVFFEAKKYDKVISFLRIFQPALREGCTSYHV